MKSLELDPYPDVRSVLKAFLDVSFYAQQRLLPPQEAFSLFHRLQKIEIIEKHMVLSESIEQ